MKHLGSFVGVCLLIGALMLSGCQGKTGPDQQGNATGDTPAAAKVDDKSKEKTAQLTIYCEEDQPREFLTKDGALSGMSVEIVREIQKRVGNTDQIKMVPWARGYTEIQNQPNVVLFSMARNAERNTMFQWVGPIDEISYAFYAKSGSPIVIKSLEDAKKVKSIGVIKNEIRELFLKKAGFTNLVEADDTAQNYKKLVTGRIDLLPASSDPTELESKTKEIGLKATDFKNVYVFTKTQLYVAMSKETSANLVKSWNEALDAMKADGTYEKIFRKYFPQKALPGPTVTTFDQ